MGLQRKNILAFCFCFFSVLLISIAFIIERKGNEQGVQIINEEDRIQLSENQAMTIATHILDAIYLGENLSSEGVELMFKPLEMIKGNLDEEDISIIYVQPSRKSFEKERIDSFPLLTNNKYMLFLEKNISVYYEHNKYVQIDNMIISSKDSLKWNQYHKLANRLVLAEGGTISNEFGVPFSKSEEITDLIDFSSNIFIVRINSIYAESKIAPTTVYCCSVTKCIKGNPQESGDILITMFNNSVTVGEEYCVLLADATKTAPIYTLSAKKNCVYSLSQAQSIPVFKELLVNATDYFANSCNTSDQEILLQEKSVNSGK